jgi:hypothetical protein
MKMNGGCVRIWKEAAVTEDSEEKKENASRLQVAYQRFELGQS